MKYSQDESSLQDKHEGDEKSLLEIIKVMMNKRNYILTGLMLLSTGISAQSHNDSIPKSAQSIKSKASLYTEVVPREGWSDGNSLHAGLNASMDLSVYTTFGGRRHRSGFAQTANVAYATPIGKRVVLLLAVISAMSVRDQTTMWQVRFMPNWAIGSMINGLPPSMVRSR